MGERFDSAPTVVTSLSVPPRSQALAEEVALLISKRRPRGIGHACKTTPGSDSIHSTPNVVTCLSLPDQRLSQKRWRFLFPSTAIAPAAVRSKHTWSSPWRPAAVVGSLACVRLSTGGRRSTTSVRRPRDMYPASRRRSLFLKSSTGRECLFSTFYDASTLSNEFKVSGRSSAFR